MKIYIDRPAWGPEYTVECAPLAQVAKLVDAPDLGSGAARCGGSSPFLGTKYCEIRLSIRKALFVSGFVFTQTDKFADEPM